MNFKKKKTGAPTKQDVQLTREELKEALPEQLKSSASQELVDKVNNLALNPEIAENFRTNILGCSKVLMEGKFKVEDYLNAVIYISYKLMGQTNQKAYELTFPARYQALVARGADEKEISAYVASYNKGKLVNLVREQSMIPTWVYNQDIYQEAINTQAVLMNTSNSDMVRTQAANSILTHLKPPETKKLEIDLGVRQDSALEKLKQTLHSLAQTQMELIGQGVTTREIAHQKLIDGSAEEAVEVSPSDERDKA